MSIFPFLFVAGYLLLALQELAQLPDVGVFLMGKSMRVVHRVSDLSVLAGFFAINPLLLPFLFGLADTFGVAAWKLWRKKRWTLATRGALTTWTPLMFVGSSIVVLVLVCRRMVFDSAFSSVVPTRFASSIALVLPFLVPFVDEHTLKLTGTRFRRSQAGLGVGAALLVIALGLGLDIRRRNHAIGLHETRTSQLMSNLSSRLGDGRAATPAMGIGLGEVSFHSVGNKLFADYYFDASILRDFPTFTEIRLSHVPAILGREPVGRYSGWKDWAYRSWRRVSTPWWRRRERPPTLFMGGTRIASRVDLIAFPKGAFAIIVGRIGISSTEFSELLEQNWSRFRTEEIDIGGTSWYFFTRAGNESLRQK